MSNRAGLDEVALFPVGEQGAGFNLGKAAKLQVNDADRPFGVLKAHRVDVFFLVKILAMAALAHFTQQPVDYRGAALPRGRFRSVTPP